MPDFFVGMLEAATPKARFIDGNEYLWCYSERMNWWKNETPPGLEQAIVNARRKIADHQPLGFEIDPLIAAAEKARKAAR
jgi:hypothetical protein